MEPVQPLRLCNLHWISVPIEATDEDHVTAERSMSFRDGYRTALGEVAKILDGQIVLANDGKLELLLSLGVKATL